MAAQPYTEADLAWAERIVQELHGLTGFDAWAQHIAQALAACRRLAEIDTDYDPSRDM